MLVKVKVKVTLVQALRFCTGRTAHRGSRGIALPFRDHGTRRSGGSASLPGHSLPPGKTRYTLYRRLGGPQGRSGQVRKISTPNRDSIPGPTSPQPVAIPTTLPGPLCMLVIQFIYSIFCMIIRSINSHYFSKEHLKCGLS